LKCNFRTDKTKLLETLPEDNHLVNP